MHLFIDFIICIQSANLVYSTQNILLCWIGKWSMSVLTLYLHSNQIVRAKCLALSFPIFIILTTCLENYSINLHFEFMF